MTFTKPLLSALALLTLTACGGPIELVGSYTTSFGTPEEITESTWGAPTIEDYDNDARWAVLKNGADAMFGPNTYAKYVWTEVQGDGSFYYCTVDYGKETLEGARTSTQTANASDPEKKGCGGFGWTGMTKK